MYIISAVKFEVGDTVTKTMLQVVMYQEVCTFIQEISDGWFYNLLGWCFLSV